MAERDMLKWLLRGVGRRVMIAGFNARQYDMGRNGEEWLVRTLAPSLDTVIDVGANSGSWSDAVLRHAPSARLVAVEPIPPFAEKVRARLGSRATVAEAALSDAEGEITIYQAGGGGSAVPMTQKALVPHNVKMTTGDKLAAEHELSGVSLIKIDTDGYDMPVLRGFEGITRAHRPIIQFEYSRLWIGTRHYLKDAFDHFKELDYVLGRLMPRGIEFASGYSVGMEVFLTNNYIAVPKEKRSLLR